MRKLPNSFQDCAANFLAIIGVKRFFFPYKQKFKVGLEPEIFG